MRVVTYDVEIAKPIRHGADGKPDWDYARRGGCGLSSAVAFDTASGRYHIYDKHTIDALVAHLNAADLVVGFNSIGFDNEVVSSLASEQITSKQCDLLDAFKANFSIKGGGWRLGEVCERTLGLEKSGNGASAPELFAKGHWGELVDYNLNDVHLTRSLFNHIQEHNYVIGPHGDEVEIYLNLESDVRA